MRKILSIAAAMMLITTMLFSGALAQGSKGQKDGTGAGRGQEHTNRQNAPGRSQGDQDDDRDSAGDDRQKPSGQRDNKEKDWESFDQDKDNSEGSEDADDESEDGDAGTTPDDKDKPARDHERHEPKGRLKNIQAVTDAIGKLTDADTAAQLNTLLAAYQNATDETSAKTALIALLDALAKAGTQVNPVDNGGVEQDQPLVRMNVERLREKVLMHAGNSNGTLLALLHAYENALRFKDHQEDAIDTDDDTDTDTDTGLETGNDSADGQTGAGAQTGEEAGLDEAVEQLNNALDSAG